jgi:hypothetical protein
MVNAKDNISNKASDVNLASDLAVFLACGEKTPVNFRDDLEQRIRRQLNRSDYQLPAPLEN